MNENDYLIDENVFLESMISRMRETSYKQFVVNKLRAFMKELNDISKLEGEQKTRCIERTKSNIFINDPIFSKNIYEIIGNKDLDIFNKYENAYITSCFHSIFYRFLILDDPAAQPLDIEDFKIKIEQGKYPLVDTSDASEIEIVYLCRFARALSLIDSNESCKKTKKLAMLVGKHLEGSYDKPLYTNGGRCAKNTIRRLNLIQYYFNFSNKNRKRKSSTNYPNNEITYEEIWEGANLINQLDRSDKSEGSPMEFVDYYDVEADNNKELKRQRVESSLQTQISCSQQNSVVVESSNSANQEQTKEFFWQGKKDLLELFWQFTKAWDTEDIQNIKDLYVKLKSFPENETKILERELYSSKEKYLTACKSTLGMYEDKLKSMLPNERLSMFSTVRDIKKNVIKLKEIINEFSNQELDFSCKSSNFI